MAIVTHNKLTDFIINMKTIFRKMNRKIYSTKSINVNIYVFDALSRFRFKKQMIYTKKYLNVLSRQYSIYEMMKYHTLGVNSPLNYRGFIYGNKYYSLFKAFKEKSNLTSAVPGYYDANLNLCGSSNKKYVDINIQLYKNCTNPYLYGKNIRCLGNKQRHQHQLDIVESLLNYNHKNAKKLFSYTSFMESHDSSFISLTRMDKDFSYHLKTLKNMKVLDESITILIGDHGIHYGEYYRSEVLIGKYYSLVRQK